MNSSCLRRDIRNFLRQQGKRPILGFKNNDGTEATDAQARAFLYGELAQGHAYAPLCGHNNFDHVTGWCRGQRKEEKTP
jgi:hypothetical protein